MLQCPFCTKPNLAIDWKDAEMLRKFLSAGMKIKSRKKTGLCAKHQRQIAKTIKRSRAMGILPFVPE